LIDIDLFIIVGKRESLRMLELGAAWLEKVVGDWRRLESLLEQQWGHSGLGLNVNKICMDSYIETRM
jgi:hypothetical protein